MEALRSSSRPRSCSSRKELAAPAGPCKAPTGLRRKTKRASEVRERGRVKRPRVGRLRSFRGNQAVSFEKEAKKDGREGPHSQRRDGRPAGEGRGQGLREADANGRVPSVELTHGVRANGLWATYLNSTVGVTAASLVSEGPLIDSWGQLATALERKSGYTLSPKKAAPEPRDGGEQTLDVRRTASGSAKCSTSERKTGVRGTSREMTHTVGQRADSEKGNFWCS